MELRLPGRCAGCGAAVLFTGKRWQDAGRRAAHVCPQERSECGAWMRNARVRCARRPGHGYEHRSRYALDNARQAA